MLAIILKTMSRIIIVGKAASGKDHLAKKLVERGFNKDVSLTTRPEREGELDGTDYFFVSERDFDRMESDNQFYESVQFNGWKYATLLESWKRNDVFIMTPSGVNQISKEERKDSFAIYIDIPIEVRRKRLELRSDADKVERRIEADEKDFENFTDYDIRIDNPNF